MERLHSVKTFVFRNSWIPPMFSNFFCGCLIRESFLSLRILRSLRSSPDEILQQEVSRDDPHGRSSKQGLSLSCESKVRA